MDTHPSATTQSAPRPPLRLWPGVAFVVLLGIARWVLPQVLPDQTGTGILVSLAGALGILLWWLLFSRAPWSERLGVPLIVAGVVWAVSRFVHPSITNGMMGLMLSIYSIPFVSMAWVVWAASRHRFGAVSRWGWCLALMLLACVGFTLVRTDGLTSAAGSELHWRWTPTAEERLLSSQAAPASASPAAGLTTGIPRGPESPIWPGFRGPRRDGVVRGVRLETNWTASPPVELWRQPVGPGWSSFAVSGDRFYTQEQRGEHEMVSCYQITNGAPVWQHQDPARFWESNAGAGPRGTPTLHEGRVYTFGGTGILNALDARTGARLWSRDVTVEAKKKAPDWGFSSSPWVGDDVVVVAATGTLLAYDRATGVPRWTGPADGQSYSSPQETDINGVKQLLLMSGVGLTSVSPRDGKVLWQHAWPGVAIVQPASVAPGELLLSTGDRTGSRRIDVTREGEAWKTTERWTSNRLKAYFNDFVLHEGHAYGFDGGMLTCLELKDGSRRWKDGRYGGGQLLLLADQGLLLVLAENGDVALVPANPEGYAEVARIHALEGKTWNHPVVAGDVLLVRNDREMTAYRLPVLR